MDDVQLIDQALAGDAEAFGLLVQKYQDRLYNAMVHVVGSRVEAQDVAQEAFVQAFVKLETFQRASSFYTWLYRIAFNVSATRRRQTRPAYSVEQTREVSGEEPVDHAAPADRLIQDEVAREVQKALATLSEDHRAILILREVEGCGYEAIAEMLGLAVGTVRSRLHRARTQLRDQLKRVMQEDLK